MMGEDLLYHRPSHYHQLSLLRVSLRSRDVNAQQMKRLDSRRLDYGLLVLSSSNRVSVRKRLQNSTIEMLYSNEI